MNYRRIYNSLINKRLYREVISQDEIGQNHHIIPKCLGGTEMVRLTIREHIFAHELLVLIYKNEEPNDKAYKCMLTSIVFLYKAKDKRPDWDNISFHKSRLIEKWILESYNIRKNRTKIKNIKLKKTKWWDASKPLTDKMINDGWEYGQYLNDDQMALKSKQSRNRIWVCKHGCPDKMIDPKLLDEYVA